jgi:hypothetical protein
MALYLEGKIPVDANDLSPKEATEMSRDIKYIGMDVHKERRKCRTEPQQSLRQRQ